VLIALNHGWLVLVLVVALLIAAVACLLTGRATAPTVALVAQLPAFVSVALITQYATFTWFVAGLAVCSQSLVRRRDEPAEAVRKGIPPHSRPPSRDAPQMVRAVVA